MSKVTPARRRSLPVQVDHVTVGCGAPVVVVQSMTNTDTADVDALYLSENSDRVDERWDGTRSTKRCLAKCSCSDNRLANARSPGGTPRNSASLCNTEPTDIAAAWPSFLSQKAASR